VLLVFFIPALILTLRIDMSTAAPLSSVASPQTEVRTPENVRPKHVAYVENPMIKTPVTPAASWWSSLFGPKLNGSKPNPKPFTPVVPQGAAGGGRRRRSVKKTHRKKRAKKTRRRH